MPQDAPLSVRIEIEDSVFDGAKLRKTAVFGASDKTEHLLSYLREKGMTPIFVQLKSGDTQQDVDHRSFFDAADAAEA